MSIAISAKASMQAFIILSIPEAQLNELWQNNEFSFGSLWVPASGQGVSK